MNIQHYIKEIEAYQNRGLKMFIRTRKTDGKLFSVPSSKRGNATYAWKSGQTLSGYKERFLQGIVDFSVLFVTLVVPCDKSRKGCRESWITVSKVIGPFNKALKKLGAVKYIRVLESTSEGSCHAHLLLDWGRTVQVSFRNNKYYLADEKLLNLIKDKWYKAWKKNSELPLNGNSISIQVCHDLLSTRKAFEYTTKHLGKWSDIKIAIRRVNENTATMNDISKLFSNYWAFTLKIRLYCLSSNLWKKN